MFSLGFKYFQFLNFYVSVASITKDDILYCIFKRP